MFLKWQSANLTFSAHKYLAELAKDVYVDVEPQTLYLPKGSLSAHGVEHLRMALCLACAIELWMHVHV